MDISSTRTIESKILPGVKFSFRVMSDAVRTRLNLKLAKTMDDIRDMQLEIDSIDVARDAEGNIDKKDPNARRASVEVAKLIDKARRLRRTTIDPAFFDECFLNVEGLTIDQKEVTKTSLREYAPEDFMDEILAAIKGESELSGEEAQNLESPTTSDAGAGGQTQSTIAPSVEMKDTTSPETVTSISPTT